MKKTRTKSSYEDLDRQAMALYPLFRFMAYKRLSGFPFQDIDDFIQEWFMVFRQIILQGGIENPKNFMYHFLRARAADYIEEATRDEYSYKPRLRARTGRSNKYRLIVPPKPEQPLKKEPEPPRPRSYVEDDPETAARERFVRAERRILKKVLDEVLGNDKHGGLFRKSREYRSYARLAAAEGLTPGQVRGRLSRCRSRLQRQLRKRGYEKSFCIKNRAD